MKIINRLFKILLETEDEQLYKDGIKTLSLAIALGLLSLVGMPGSMSFMSLFYFYAKLEYSIQKDKKFL